MVSGCHIRIFLKKISTTNFQEWDLVGIHHVNEPKKVAVNMVCKFWHPHIRGEIVRLDNWEYSAKDGNKVNH